MLSRQNTLEYSVTPPFHHFPDGKIPHDGYVLKTVVHQDEVFLLQMHIHVLMQGLWKSPLGIDLVYLAVAAAVIKKAVLGGGSYFYL